MTLIVGSIIQIDDQHSDMKQTRLIDLPPLEQRIHDKVGRFQRVIKENMKQTSHRLQYTAGRQLGCRIGIMVSRFLGFLASGLAAATKKTNVEFSLRINRNA